jgi:hypothetical protein
MAQFQKKPVIIEAVEYQGRVDDKPLFAEEPDWLIEAFTKQPGEPGAMYAFGGDLIICTLEGDHTARRGDWIIRGIQGELYPCKPAIFAATYQPVDA